MRLSIRVHIKKRAGNNTKQIVILSGKGGTGKTTITSAIASIIKNKIVADCDVEAANLHIVFDSDNYGSTDFIGGNKAKINLDKCTKCKLCEQLCRFDAIDNFVVDKIGCEGCSYIQ